MPTPNRSTLVFRLTPEARAEVLRRFPPRFSETIADHITYASDQPQDAPLPSSPQSVRVVGYSHDEALEALVAEVDGSTTRPDGGTYHITLSLEPDQRRAQDSNHVLQAGWQPCEPFLLTVSPQRDN